MFQPVPEEGSVGQPAQGVVESLVLELLLQALAFRDVTQCEDNSFHRGVAQEVVGHHLDMAPRPVPVADAPLRCYGRSRPERHPAVRGDRLLHVVLVQQGRELDALERTSAVTKDALGRRRLIDDRRIRPGDKDDVGGILHQRLEPGFAAASVERLGQYLAVEGQANLGGQRFERVGQVDRQLVGAAHHDEALKLLSRDERADKQVADTVLATQAVGVRSGAAHGLTGGQAFLGRQWQGTQVNDLALVERARAGDNRKNAGPLGHGQADRTDLGLAPDQFADCAYGGVVDFVAPGGPYQLGRLSP